MFDTVLESVAQVAASATGGDVTSPAAGAAVVIGAGYGVLQALAAFLTMVLPKNTVAFRIAKWFLAGADKE